jgi:hypothetical protein
MGDPVVEIDQHETRPDQRFGHPDFLPVKAAMAASPAALMRWSTTSARSRVSASASGAVPLRIGPLRRACGRDRLAEPAKAGHYVRSFP